MTWGKTFKPVYLIAGDIPAAIVDRRGDRHSPFHMHDDSRKIVIVDAIEVDGLVAVRSDVRTYVYAADEVVELFVEEPALEKLDKAEGAA